ncbi:MAG: hypothetical protein LBJ64_08570 [Deltaproteobacteria bacterium]|jgi:hypothetical protein|nr:hypothetical protein [Deltaproteobacteria bacterium]
MLNDSATKINPFSTQKINDYLPSLSIIKAAKLQLRRWNKTPTIALLEEKPDSPRPYPAPLGWAWNIREALQKDRHYQTIFFNLS